MNILDPIILDNLERIRVPVKLGGEEYVLLEADGAAITERDNAVVAGTAIATRINTGIIVQMISALVEWLNFAAW